MKRFVISILALSLSAAAAALAVAAQEPFTSETDDYAIELPSQSWKAVTRSGASQQYTEFVYGDRLNGYLRLRKEVVDGDVKLSDFARGEQDAKLRFLPGFVGGKEEVFTGRLKGIVTNYEYTSGGKAMAGRLYYLQADNRTIYAIHFTGLRDKLQLIQNQTDSIARSFKLKQ